MASSIKNVILIGGNGSIGGPILKALIASKKFNVSVLARTESTSTYPESITVFKSDYTSASLIQAFTGQDAVVSALGAGGLSSQISVIDAAVAAGVKRFLPAEYGSNTLNPKGASLVPVFGIKAAAIEHLKKQEAKGLSWTAIPAGLAFEIALHIGILPYDIKTHTAQIYDGGERRFSLSTLSRIGSAVVSVLSKPDETANQVIYVDSFTVSQNEILAAFEKVTGKKWTVTESTTEAAAKEGTEAFAKGDFSGLLLILKAVFMGEGYGSDFTKDAVLGNSKLNLPGQALDKTVKDFVDGREV